MVPSIFDLMKTVNNPKVMKTAETLIQVILSLPGQIDNLSQRIEDLSVRIEQLEQKIDVLKKGNGEES